MKIHTTTISAFVALLTACAFAIPQTAEARPPQARELCGVIQAFDPQTRTVTIQSSKRDLPSTFVVKGDTRFIQDWKSTDAASLKAGMRAYVYYRSPFFGKPFVTKVVWTKPPQPR